MNNGYYSDGETVYRVKNRRCAWIGYMQNGELMDPDYYLDNYDNDEQKQQEIERMKSLRSQLTTQLRNPFTQRGEFLGAGYPTLKALQVETGRHIGGEHDDDPV